MAAWCPTCGGMLRPDRPCLLCTAMQPPARPDPAPGEPDLPTADPSCFDADAAAYDRYLDGARGWLRQELAAGNLLEVLPDLARRSRRVLDLGGGSGRLAVRLARLGHQVELVDPSREMVRRARRRVRADGLGDRIRVRLGDGESLRAGSRPGYDLVALHNVLEYVADPAALLQRAAATLAPDASLSLLVANRLARPVSAAIAGADPSAIAASLARRRFPTDLFGGVRHEDSPAELAALVAQAGLELHAVRGVLIYAALEPDLVVTARNELEWLRLELTAGRETANLGLARYVQVIAHRAS